ncbi:MAG: hypothetical protein Q8L48_21980 [Archangium sp.]|nr:hypothetical protein [Archangium sp.]
MRIVLLCLLMGLSGCRKKTSAEFYNLESRQSILIAREGDDAFDSDEMKAVLVGLDAVPEDTIEKPRAAALASKLRAEQARVARERAPKPKDPPPADPFAGRFPPTDSAPAPEAVPGVVSTDAGSLELVAGMEEKTFVALFGKCFSPGPPGRISDGGVATTQVVGPSADCVKRFGAPGSVTSYLFTRSGYWGKSESRVVVVVDAGVAPGPAVEPTERQPVRLMPGAPVPEGYETTSPN